MTTVNLQITLHSPMHIGAIAYRELPGDKPAPIVRDVRGKPCIPAATMKGLHRAAVEQIAQALGLKICRAPVAAHMCHPLGVQTAQTAQSAHMTQIACAVCR